MPTEVALNAALSRYEIHVDGELAGFTQIQPGATDSHPVVFPHTEIDRKFSGQGLAKKLIGGALDDARAKGQKIVPVCAFVQSFVAKNPDYQDLVA